MFRMDSPLRYLTFHRTSETSAALPISSCCSTRGMNSPPPRLRCRMLHSCSKVLTCCCMLVMWATMEDIQVRTHTYTCSGHCHNQSRHAMMVSVFALS